MTFLRHGTPFSLDDLDTLAREFNVPPAFFLASPDLAYGVPEDVKNAIRDADFPDR